MNRQKKPQARDLVLEADDHPEAAAIDMLPERPRGYKGDGMNFAKGQGSFKKNF